MFPLTENPMREGGRWVTGRTDGIDWNDIQSAGGKGGAGEFSSTIAPPYNDSLAQLTTSALACNANQFAEATIFVQSGYVPPSTHEMALWLRMQIAPHVMRGYEAYLNWGGNFGIVRSNGAINDFTFINLTGPGPKPPSNGDVIRFEVNGSTLRYYQNGILVATGTDTTWSDGQPGMGSYLISGGTFSDYAFTRWTGGSL
jgi:hypothetical protein